MQASCFANIPKMNVNLHEKIWKRVTGMAPAKKVP